MVQWCAESAPLGWDRVMASENFGATSVAPVAPVVTSLSSQLLVVQVVSTLIKKLRVDTIIWQCLPLASI